MRSVTLIFNSGRTIPGLADMSFTARVAAIFYLLLTASSLIADERIIPAFTAYLLPDPEAARVSEAHGITRWRDSTQSVNWYGRFANIGDLTCRVAMKPADRELRFRLSVGEQSLEATVPASTSGEDVLTDFGRFMISQPGHHRITLQSLSEPGQPCGDLTDLRLDGPAAIDAHFNLKERRNAASVHLMYPTDESIHAAAFYCEVTAVEDPIHTFYMACGWHRGYFGMQVNSPTERRIIFSVWDSGDEAVDRKNVTSDNRVRLLGKGDSVFAGDFGNEGTGGHSHLKFMWKTGTPQRFIVTAESVDKTFTIYSGYWFHPDEQKWMLISSWKAPREGGYLRGLHSFSENFGGSTGHLLRKARFGNQWLRTPDGTWQELTSARFSHDPTGKSDRFDRFMDVEDSQFFLSHGGFVDGFTEYGTAFTRPATDTPPGELDLPEITLK